MSFRICLRELGAWLNVTGTRLNSTAQAAAIQRGLQGLARDFALSLPSAAISFGGSINGVMSDPVAYPIYTLSNRFESLEERIMRSGTVLLDFQPRPNERIDELLARFDMARQEAASVGAAITN